jgi:hypothetical protein
MKTTLWLAVAVTAGCTEYDVFIDTREQTIDEYATVEGARTDILFFADTSHSMQTELERIGSAISTFTDRIEENQTDWQLAAVTGPDGCANRGILKPTTADWQAKFAEGIATPPGRDDVDEWGLFNAFQAVLKSAPGGCNDGFIRQGATLHVVFLSDEDDNSPGWELGGDYWRDYVDPILYVKDDPSQVRFSSITGPVPNGCFGAEAGTGYVDAAQFTRGETISICDDWSDEVSVLADASILQTWFPLLHDPLPDTMLVSVNGENRREGFTVETTEAGSGVRFTDNPPGAWDEVHFRYRAMVEFEVTDTDAEAQ